MASAAEGGFGIRGWPSLLDGPPAAAALTAATVAAAATLVGLELDWWREAEDGDEDSGVLPA